MDFIDLIKLMFRWWFITIPIVVLTVVATVVLSDRVDPEFTARGSMILTAPTEVGVGESGVAGDTVNPLLSLNGALPTTAYITALSVGSPQVASILAEEGYSTSFDVATETRMPIILLETRAPTREIATGTALRIIELVDNDLQLRQDAADVPADERVTADVISVAVVGGADYGGRTRMRIVILGLGVGLAVGAVFVLEGIRQRRRARRQMDSAPEAVGGETPDSAPERVGGETPDSAPERVDGETPDSAPERVDGETPDSAPERVDGETPDFGNELSFDEHGLLVERPPADDGSGSSSRRVSESSTASVR